MGAEHAGGAMSDRCGSSGVSNETVLERLRRSRREDALEVLQRRVEGLECALLVSRSAPQAALPSNSSSPMMSANSVSADAISLSVTELSVLSSSSTMRSRVTDAAGADGAVSENWKLVDGEILAVLGARSGPASRLSRSLLRRIPTTRTPFARSLNELNAKMLGAKPRGL